MTKLYTWFFVTIFSILAATTFWQLNLATAETPITPVTTITEVTNTVTNVATSSGNVISVTPGVIYNASPSGQICAQVITRACKATPIYPVNTASSSGTVNSVTICQDFPTPCDVPSDWTVGPNLPETPYGTICSTNQDCSLDEVCANTAGVCTKDGVNHVTCSTPYRVCVPKPTVITQFCGNDSACSGNKYCEDSFAQPACTGPDCTVVSPTCTDTPIACGPKPVCDAGYHLNHQTFNEVNGYACPLYFCEVNKPTPYSPRPISRFCSVDQTLDRFGDESYTCSPKDPVFCMTQSNCAEGYYCPRPLNLSLPANMVADYICLPKLICAPGFTKEMVSGVEICKIIAPSYPVCKINQTLEYIGESYTCSPKDPVFCAAQSDCSVGYYCPKPLNQSLPSNIVTDYICLPKVNCAAGFTKEIISGIEICKNTNIALTAPLIIDIDKDEIFPGDKLIITGKYFAEENLKVQINNSFDLEYSLSVGGDSSYITAYLPTEVQWKAGELLSLKVVNDRGESNEFKLKVKPFTYQDVELGSKQLMVAPQVTISKDQNEVVVVDSNFDSKINIPSDTNGVLLNLSNLTWDHEGSRSAYFVNQLTVEASTNLGLAKLNVATGTTIWGDAHRWSGFIAALSILDPKSIVLTSEGALKRVISAIVEVGSDGVGLSLNRAVRINVPGQASALAGWINGATLQDISNICMSDTQEAGDDLIEGKDCKTTSGNDLVIWTKHLTKFVAYSIVDTSIKIPGTSSNPNNNTISSGSSNSGSNSNSNSSACVDAKPGSAPKLLAALKSGPNQVTLTWNKAVDPLTHYLIAYGLSSGKMQFGSPKVGDKNTTSFVVRDLDPRQTYYFKVKAINVCNPGEFSNEIAIQPFGEIAHSSVQAQNFLRSDVLSETKSEAPDQQELLGNSQDLHQTISSGEAILKPSGAPIKVVHKGFFAGIGEFFARVFSGIGKAFSKH